MTQTQIQSQIHSIKNQLIKKYKPQKIILFGSYAYGNPRKDSDVDLLVIKKTNARHIDRSTKIREIFCKCKFLSKNLAFLRKKLYTACRCDIFCYIFCYGPKPNIYGVTDFKSSQN